MKRVKIRILQISSYIRTLTEYIVHMHYLLSHSHKYTYTPYHTPCYCSLFHIPPGTCKHMPFTPMCTPPPPQADTSTPVTHRISNSSDPSRQECEQSPTQHSTILQLPVQTAGPMANLPVSDSLSSGHSVPLASDSDYVLVKSYVDRVTTTESTDFMELLYHAEVLDDQSLTK